MTKRVLVLRIFAGLAAVLLAYYAGYMFGNGRRLREVKAWSGDWAWYADTDDGPAYVLDVRNGYDGTVMLDFGDGSNPVQVPLYVW